MPNNEDHHETDFVGADDADWVAKSEETKLAAIERLTIATDGKHDWLMASLDNELRFSVVALTRDVPRQIMAVMLMGGPAFSSLLKDLNFEQNGTVLAEAMEVIDKALADLIERKAPKK